MYSEILLAAIQRHSNCHPLLLLHSTRPACSTRKPEGRRKDPARGPSLSCICLSLLLSKSLWLACLLCNPCAFSKVTSAAPPYHEKWLITLCAGNVSILGESKLDDGTAPWYQNQVPRCQKPGSALLHSLAFPHGPKKNG